MHTPFFNIGTIPVSGITYAPGTVQLVRARTLSITTRVTFGASIDADAVVYVFYSPDGSNWDSEALTSWGITFTVSTTKQITKIIDVPEHGYIRWKIQNGSSADVLNNWVGWYTIQSWPPSGDIGRGATYIDRGEEQQMTDVIPGEGV